MLELGRLLAGPRAWTVRALGGGATESQGRPGRWWRVLVTLTLAVSMVLTAAEPPNRVRVGKVVELALADGTRLADAKVVLECPHVTTALHSDARGHVTLPERVAGERCRLQVEAQAVVYEGVLAADAGDLEHITLAPRPLAVGGGTTVSMEEAREVSVGSHFSSVVEVSHGISLAGTTGAGSPHDQDVSPGTLTAGAIDDLRTPGAFARFLAALDGHHPAHARFSQAPRMVAVTDRAGRPVAGAAVRVGGRTLRTRRNGHVVVIPGWDGVNGAAIPPARIVLDAPAAAPPARVDLAIVLDTTGSMGDELHYLQVELEHLLSRLDEKYAELDIRWGLVVYRDEGDAYVARAIDFDRDFERFSEMLGAQRAEGGGDAPEAVHTALALTQWLAWRDPAEAARVIVHLADAPPHEANVTDALRAADRLRGQGTVIYPVAASGIDELGEFSMRAMALMSGGQYVFLTDDSGVGNPHREATAACYRGDKLIHILGVILEAEIEGRRPTLPTGRRGAGCPGQRSRPRARAIPAGPPETERHPLERSLLDDDGASRLLHLPRVIRSLP